MQGKAYQLVTGTLFGLIALGHLARLIDRIPVQIGTWGVPLWPSMIAVALAGALCVWALRLLRSH